MWKSPAAVRRGTSDLRYQNTGGEGNRTLAVVILHPGLLTDLGDPKSVGLHRRNRLAGEAAGGVGISAGPANPARPGTHGETIGVLLPHPLYKRHKPLVLSPLRLLHGLHIKIILQYAGRLQQNPPSVLGRPLCGLLQGAAPWRAGPALAVHAAPVRRTHCPYFRHKFQRLHIQRTSMGKSQFLRQRYPPL